MSIKPVMESCPKKAQLRALKQTDAIKRWIASGGGDPVASGFLRTLREEGLRISRGTLYNWARKYRRGGNVVIDGRTMRAAQRRAEMQETLYSLRGRIATHADKLGLDDLHTLDKFAGFLAKHTAGRGGHRSTRPGSHIAMAWLDVDAVKPMTGYSDGHLRRLCRKNLQRKGFARMFQGRGVRSRWQIRSDAVALIGGRSPFDGHLNGVFEGGESRA